MLILDNCLIFDGASPDLEHGSIIIEDDVVREVNGRRSVGNASADVIDMGGRFVMPGLIDAHFHSYWFAWAPAVVESTALELRGLHAKRLLEGALRRGFTTIRDAAGGDVSLARAIQMGLIDGPRFFYPGLALSQTGGHGDLRPADSKAHPHDRLCGCSYSGPMTIAVDGPDEVRKAVREQLRTGATHIKLFLSGGPTLSPNDPSWMPQFGDVEIQIAVEEAATRCSYVMAHAHNNDAILRSLKNGVRSVEHVTMIEPDGARAIVESDAFAVPTLAALDALGRLGPALGMPYPYTMQVEEMAEAGARLSERVLVSLDHLRNAGARIGFGTDLCGVFLDGQLSEFVLRSAVCTPLEILRSATSINAELVQMKGKLGTVAPGAFADLLAVDGNPLEDIQLMGESDNFAMIMRAGKIIKNRVQQ